MTFRPAQRRHLVPILGLVTLFAFMSASLGVVPSASMVAGWFGTVWSTPYPCQDHACGCASPHECWTACCCHSEHERLVWAIEHGVMPPKDVTFTDEQWIAAANAVRPGSAHCSLCVETLKASLASGVATNRAPGSNGPRIASSCCDESAAGAKPHATAPSATGAAPCCGTSSGTCASKPKNAPARWGMSALTCKGKNLLLAIGFPPVPRSAAMGELLPAPVFAERVATGDEHVISRPLDPSVPPPRA
ncbi:MAG: hypothetical protein IT432_09365 [Phycisphaerales bacterium]|nr:hypothetical protein [Phycisphaerales bacterium]